MGLVYGARTNLHLELRSGSAVRPRLGGKGRFVPESAGRKRRVRIAFKGLADIRYPKGVLMGVLRARGVLLLWSGRPPPAGVSGEGDSESRLAGILQP